MDKEKLLRKEIVYTCLKMNQMGINQGTSGNVSVRWKEGMLISPSGLPYEETLPEDIIYIEFAHNRAEGPHKPSSEWGFHRHILVKREDINAVVHTHSPYATAMAIHRIDIPAHHYMIAAAGGSKIQCAEYATFGTLELAQNALKALGSRFGCLLAHHGVIAIGIDLAKTLWLANEIEILAKQYFIASQYGKPAILPDEEMDRVIEGFKSYGPKKDDV